MLSEAAEQGGRRALGLRAVDAVEDHMTAHPLLLRAILRWSSSCTYLHPRCVSVMSDPLCECDVGLFSGYRFFGICSQNI